MLMSIFLPLSDLESYIQKHQNSIIIIDRNDSIVVCNDGFLNSTGYKKEEIQSLAAHQVLQIEAKAHTKKMMADGEQHRPVAKVRVKCGNLLSTEYSMYPLTVGNEEQAYMYILHDIEDKMYGLSLLQQFSGTFLKDVNLGVILINTEFRLMDISDMACRILGVNRENIIAKPMDDVFSAVPIEHQLVQRTILDGVVVRNHAISWTNNQERYELLMDSNLLKDHTGATVGAYVIFKDVSNLRSLEEQVQRSDRLAMIGQIAAGTAHEIRNPLTSIKGFMQVLKKTLYERGMEKEYGYTGIMLTEIDRINELVSEFLLLSKPKNITFDQVDMSTVLREILPIINNEAILHGVTVQYQSSFETPKVVADRELLKQVCLNICKNGIEAMVAGGILTITERIDQVEQRVNVEIHDTGPGIPAFLIDKIFDPFFTTKENGTGLGLSVCQRIIHDIGGNIRVSSKGFGTTFTVSIPFSKNQ